MKKKVGLLVMAYGTPYKEEDIESYYTHIRHGRKPALEMLEDLVSRYKAIGGLSPLAGITIDQANALATKLNEVQEDVEFIMYLGLKHIHPFIEDAVAQMKADGILEAVSIVLAPHYSTFSIKSYNKRAKEETENIGGPAIYSVDEWYKEEKFVEYWKNALEDVFRMMTKEEKNNAVVIFSAHSLPEKIKQFNDPYPEQLAESAKIIAEAAAVKNYTIGWQSAGNTPDPWLGPDVQDLTEDVYNESGYKAFVYVPVGFVSDHLEVLYDNDTECKIVTDRLGVSYYRPAMPNTNPIFIEAMSNVVLSTYKKTTAVHQ